MPASPSLAELTDRRVLQARLSSAFGRIGRKHVLVGVLQGTEAAYAAVEHDSESKWPKVNSTMPTGCLTKLFLGTLIRRAVAAGHVAFGSRASEILNTASGALRGITIRQLLEHTHGIDDSRIRRVPLRSNGAIDTERLCDRLNAATRLAEPGLLYSYSNAGAWLTAALLERLNGKRFDSLLDAELLGPLGISLRRGRRVAGRDAPMCPSTGAGLAVTIPGMLAFLKEHALQQEDWPNGDERQQCSGGITPLPGWSPLERGVYLGWKSYGRGWFGHNSTWPGASALVRVQPRRAMAIVISSRYQPATLVAAKLFGALLPEFAALELPAVLSPDAARRLGPRPYVGVYRTAAESISMQASDSRFALKVGRQLGSGCEPCVAVNLRAAERNVFFAAPPSLRSFTYVQFVRPRGGLFEYLWDGRRVLRRAQATDPRGG